VTYDCLSEPLDVKICHCRDCQYASGGAFSVVAFFPAQACELKGATKSYTVKGGVGLSVSRHFCPECGTPLYSALAELPELLFVKVGTLDNPAEVKPRGHMWCDSMLPWVDAADGLERLAGNPPL
jgi:hypothetical protein